MIENKKNLFITLEGIEGVGKSTHLKFINHYLQHKNIDAVITREPGGTPVAEAIRHVLLTKYEETITGQAELLLLFAGRSQHITHVIKPKLTEGKWVVCDRFTDASYAYQGHGRGISLEEITALEKWVQGDLRPDLTLLFDAPVHVALQRTKRRKNQDRIEAEAEDFFQRIREGYLARAKLFPERYRIIDASLPLIKVQENITKILEQICRVD